MSAANPPAPFLILPGFMPDAVGFATRFAAALLLAYLVAFFIQLDSASSAGVTVAIVSVASPGMAMSKMLYRIGGTLAGGVVALVVVSVFPQDRTMLLAAFALWLGLCTLVAALLRDFRSYGAVLCGYTVGIIAVSGIDSPDGALLATLNRVAAVLIGIVSVAIVNGLLVGETASEGLVAGLRAQLASAGQLARSALAGQGVPGDEACVRIAAATLALSTEATYAATELPDGPARSAGARSAIAALLGVLSASRAIDAGLRARSQAEAGPAAEAHAIFLRERTADLRAQQALAAAGLDEFLNGGRPRRRVRLLVHHDLFGAGLTAARTVAAVGLGAVFCIYAGWPGATLLLVQQAAFTALLGMQTNPSEAGLNMGISLPLPALVAAVLGFGVLPLISGFVPFALAVGLAAFALALLARHPLFAKYGTGLLLYLVLLLAPSNTQDFDLSAFLNNVMVQAIAVLFMVVAFRLILPVSRRRRLFRIADAIRRDLRRTLREGRGLDQAAAQSLQYDRLALALTWLGRPTPARLSVLHRLYAFTDLDIALRRAMAGLESGVDAPGLAEPFAAARACLSRPNPAGMARAAAALARHAGGGPAIETAVSGLYGAHLLLTAQWRALRRYGIVED